ncbi:MAG: AAA family ATPase [Nanoarchaeota archaeon]
MKTIYVFGVSGVGKTTILNNVIEKLQKKGKKIKYISFGTIMFEIGKELYNLKNRDDLRKLNKEEYYNLFYDSLEFIKKEIVESNCDFVFIDTHILIETRFGTFIGTPRKMVEKIKPEAVVVIDAPVSEIIERAKNDKTRKRDDLLDEEKLKKRLNLTLNTAFVVAYDSHALFKEIVNKNGQLESAIREFLEFLNNL